MQKSNLADFGDLLTHAETLGYHWNQAHEILVNDGIPPEAECHKSYYYLQEVVENVDEWSEDTVKILKTFMEANSVDEFVLTR